MESASARSAGRTMVLIELEVLLERARRREAASPPSFLLPLVVVGYLLLLLLMTLLLLQLASMVKVEVEREMLSSWSLLLRPSGGD